MTQGTVTYHGGRIFDGRELIDGKAAVFVDGLFQGFANEADISTPGIELAGDSAAGRIGSSAGRSTLA